MQNTKWKESGVTYWETEVNVQKLNAVFSALVKNQCREAPDTVEGPERSESGFTVSISQGSPPHSTITQAKRSGGWNTKKFRVNRLSPLLIKHTRSKRIFRRWGPQNQTLSSIRRPKAGGSWRPSAPQRSKTTLFIIWLISVLSTKTCPSSNLFCSRSQVWNFSIHFLEVSTVMLQFLS